MYVLCLCFVNFYVMFVCNASVLYECFTCILCVKLYAMLTFSVISTCIYTYTFAYSLCSCPCSAVVTSPPGWTGDWWGVGTPAPPPPSLRTPRLPRPPSPARLAPPPFGSPCSRTCGCTGWPLGLEKCLPHTGGTNHHCCLCLTTRTTTLLKPQHC